VRGHLLAPVGARARVALRLALALAGISNATAELKRRPVSEHPLVIREEEEHGIRAQRCVCSNGVRRIGRTSSPLLANGRSQGTGDPGLVPEW
jgi:hypothetical protein